ncbi:hypothetical protein O7598_31150 [Micromonospora sp. WMMC241]|uniref:hypothetical protein n=1 Tax=Micromonospora sp. WMMC241 TaxID=3015159 RepID=UPI0022B74DB0|nr:hypothetical protein [Micromonospora sp. WMMC241]MCZ7440790.1 hypothetical protein [Micromonospora sp. WMMC241]MCZ7440883.1 hypothetical protein [Micromonospora sp. WMMC241]
MYHHAKRATPALWSIAGGICAIALIAITARVLVAFTSFTIAEPFNMLSVVLAGTCALGGPAMCGWLRVVDLRQHTQALIAENRRLRQQHEERESLAEKIRLCDQEVEVVKVKVDKVLRLLEEQQIPVGDTQPIAHLHSINGGGGA